MTGSWLASLETEASRVLPEVVFDYYRQGARDGTAAAEAVAAWQAYRVLPRAFSDVTRIDLSTDFLGWRAAAPYGVAPSTLQRAADPGGEVAMATACRDAGVPLVLSSNATALFAEVGGTGVSWWLQAYLPQDRALAEPMLAAAVAAGASAVVLTVDTPVVAAKSGSEAIWEATPAEWLRVNLGDAADAPKALDLGPADIAWLRDRTGLPVVAKGILDPADAAIAADAGAAAVWVSNHGGRQLGRAPSTAAALGGVADKVAGAVPVYVDGGVRSGMDVVTALGLGADGCFLGRLPLYALAVDGSAGVRRLFTELDTDVTEALRLAGCAEPGAVRGRVDEP